MRQTQLTGSITLPGDKSLSHRAVIFASLASGKSEIRNIPCGADVTMTITAAKSLGIKIINDKESIVINSRGFRHFRADRETLYCGNSGTTLRLLLGVLAGSNTRCRLSGDESLNRRPVYRVIAPLREMGGELNTLDISDHPPVFVEGQQLQGIKYRSPVASAQVKSAVLLAGLYADGVTEYSEPVKSRDHTERFLQDQGINIEVLDNNIRLSPGISLSPFDITLPGDISTAMFYVVAALFTRRSELLIRNVLLNETRTGAIKILKEMGGEIDLEYRREIAGEPVGDLYVRGSQLTGIDTAQFTPSHFIDEIPILAIAAMLAGGETVFHDVGELRVKESDRLTGIVDIVTSFGGRAVVSGDDLLIEGGFDQKQTVTEDFGDHRLAMSIEIANLITTGEVTGNYEKTISISAPEFYQTLKAVLR